MGAQLEKGRPSSLHANDKAAPDAESGVLPVQKTEKRRLPLVETRLVVESATAVAQFSRQHEQQGFEQATAYYRDLIPLERPRPGEQYAFEVDLNACTGCKACVVACHVLNGLDEGESFRSVGQLQGGTPEAPARQTVTSACHHCVEPACLEGCPVGAYEKSLLTGIVKHLDDQCFGCQYCTLMCPYDVPKYNVERGIVRKCDMCSDRLAHAEAPACVQACPNDAISIRVVAQSSAVAAADAGVFLPGVAAPEHTLPTTVYKSAAAMPANMLPVDYYRRVRGHWHTPLAVMLTLTELAVGTFAVSLLLRGVPASAQRGLLGATLLALGVTTIALVASLFHLGRPALAFRVIVGIKTSWLSREALAFGLFAKALAACAALNVLAPRLGARALGALPITESATALLGVFGVFCSVMVYAVTRRAQWSALQSGLRFFGTTLILGEAGALAARASLAHTRYASGQAPRLLWSCLFVSTLLKLAWEALQLRHAGARQHSALKQVANSLLAELRLLTAARFALGFCGGLVLPALFASALPSARLVEPGALLALSLLTGGELLERALFFGAAPVSRMPGNIR